MSNQFWYGMWAGIALMGTVALMLIVAMR